MIKAKISTQKMQSYKAIKNLAFLMAGSQNAMWPGVCYFTPSLGAV